MDLYIISPTRVKGDRAQFILTDHTSAIDIPICSNTHTHTDAYIKINQWLKVKDEILKSQCSVFKPTWISSVVMNPKFLNKMNILIICVCVHTHVCLWQVTYLPSSKRIFQLFIPKEEKEKIHSTTMYKITIRRN